jgi:hypothetical protein
MQSLCRWAALAFLVGTTAPGNVDPQYTPPPPPPQRAALPNSGPPPVTQKYPPSWYYNPYTQGVVRLPQSGED